MFAAIVAAAFATTRCGSSDSPTQPTTQALAGVALSAASTAAGTTVQGTVTLSAAAPTGGASVSLSSSSPVTVPPTVTVPAGSSSATFTVMTRAVTATVAPTIRGSYGGGSASVVLSVSAPTVATASFGVTGTDTSDTCVVMNGGKNLECTFNGSTSTAPGTITAWDWTYAAGASTLSQTTTGPILTNPSISCAFLPPPPLSTGATSFPLTVTLRIHDSLGNVSGIRIDSGARVLPGGQCGF